MEIEISFGNLRPGKENYDKKYEWNGIQSDTELEERWCTLMISSYCRSSFDELESVPFHVHCAFVKLNTRFTVMTAAGYWRRLINDILLIFFYDTPLFSMFSCLSWLPKITKNLSLDSYYLICYSQYYSCSLITDWKLSVSDLDKKA